MYVVAIYAVCVIYICLSYAEDRDFIGINEAFTISPGERRCFDITIVDDSVVEYTEGFSVMLSNAVAKTTSGVINVYIVDNDYGRPPA